MIHFDLDERYLDEAVVGSAISRREGAVLSVVVHVAVLALLVLGSMRSSTGPDAAARAQQQRVAAERQDQPRFVFVQPHIDMPAVRPPERAPSSDKDRRAQSPPPPAAPRNPLPFSRGNSSERAEASAERRTPPVPTPSEPRPAGQPGQAPPQPPPVPTPTPDSQTARVLPPSDRGLERSAPATPVAPRPPRGGLGDALRNLEQYVQNQTFNNPQGGQNDPGSQIQFDTKGVEFGPWLRRFVAQVRRNWFVPQAAMTFKGRVVLQFNIHKNGQITDLTVATPSDIDAFTRAAFNAIRGSNPTQSLPPEYPDEKAFFTVTFYYNEQP